MQKPGTPQRFFGGCSVPQTPINLTKELKQALNERNILTAKTRKKVCSMLDRVTPTQNNELDKRITFRRQAIQEILESEKTYLKQLEILMEFFILPLKERAIIDDASHTALFGQIEMIYNLNGELLKELENDLDNVASAFLKLAPFFKLYSVYAFDYKNALFILQDLTSKNPIFRKFLYDTETRPEVQKKLNSLMIVPIQRVPRYKLLLEQVLLYTSPADNDFKVLKESVKQVESTVSHINTVIEDQEVTQTLLNLQNSLVNRLPNIVKPSRKIIKESILDKVTRNGTQIKRYCILMSDIFMYCKILKDRSKNTLVENSLQCCCIFPLKKCKVYDVFPGHFKITCQGDGIILCTTDLHLGQSWIAAVKDAIELHIECRKTLRKESSKRTPMRKKDVKNFDSDSVLSPNKRKCDYESVFRCKINSDSDEEEEPSTSSCFNMWKTGHKRKHEEIKSTISISNINDKEECDTNLNATFKVPKTPSKHISSKFKQLWSDKKTNLMPKLKPSVNTEDYNNGQSDPDYDHTYGFANRFSDSKSYFRTHNVDSTIPTSMKRSDLILPAESETATPFMDILYPLRSSGGSNRSRSSTESNSWIHRKDGNGKENQFMQQSGNEFIIQRKRVKFDNIDSPMDDILESRNKGNRHSLKPQSFYFNIPSRVETKLPLRQRIIDFFSKLF